MEDSVDMESEDDDTPSLINRLQLQCKLPAGLATTICPNSNSDADAAAGRSSMQKLSQTPSAQHTGGSNGGSSKCRKVMDPFENRMLELMEKRTATGANATPAKIDEDYHFALSLVPTLQHISVQDKAKVKIQIQQLLYNVQFGNSQTQLQSPTPHYQQQQQLPNQPSQDTWQAPTSASEWATWHSL